MRRRDKYAVKWVRGWTLDRPLQLEAHREFFINNGMMHLLDWFRNGKKRGGLRPFTITGSANGCEVTYLDRWQSDGEP